MSRLIDAGAVALAGLAVIAWLYHSVTEHHVHLRIARLVSPDIKVPETRHDTRWHGLSHSRRLGADLAIIGCAGCIGVAWRLAPGVTLLCAGVLVLAVIVLAATRSLSKVIGSRPPESRALRRHDAESR